jgi:hypothetical protein
MAHQVNPGKYVIALMVTIVVGPVMLWAGLIAVLTIIEQILSGFFDLSQATWTQFLNPWVWVGTESLGGTGGIMDALVGGPGAPGGTVNRYFTFMIFGLITAGCYASVRFIWSWAR